MTDTDAITTEENPENANGNLNAEVVEEEQVKQATPENVVAPQMEYGQPTEQDTLSQAQESVIEEAAAEGVEQTLFNKADEPLQEGLEHDGFAGVVDVEKAEAYIAIRDRHEAGQKLEDADVDKIADLAVNYLRQILSCFGENDTTIDEFEGDEGELILELKGGDLAILIGRHGHTLSALQQAVTSYVSRFIGFRYPLIVDIEGYRDRRKEIVSDIAHKAAKRAKTSGKPAHLKPMSAYERRLVHMLLKEDPDVETYSRGERADRYVVVSPLKSIEQTSPDKSNDIQEEEAPAYNDSFSDSEDSDE